MRLIVRTAVFIVALCLVAGMNSSLWARDYDPRFMKSFPPGYYGMWYYAERFFEPQDAKQPPKETYRYDRYMSNITGLHYPFYPIPFDWDYGTWRTFNLPNYNTNDWH